MLKREQGEEGREVEVIQCAEVLDCLKLLLRLDTDTLRNNWYFE